MYFILILSSCILTGFGLYDKIGQVAGAGTILPITGFANSMSFCILLASFSSFFATSRSCFAAVLSPLRAAMIALR